MGINTYNSGAVAFFLLVDQLVKSTSDLRYNVPSSWLVAFRIDHSITLVTGYTAIIENNKLI